MLNHGLEQNKFGISKCLVATVDWTIDWPQNEIFTAFSASQSQVRVASGC